MATCPASGGEHTGVAATYCHRSYGPPFRKKKQSKVKLYREADKLWPTGQICPISYFCKEMFIGT